MMGLIRRWAAPPVIAGAIMIAPLAGGVVLKNCGGATGAPGSHGFYIMFPATAVTQGKIVHGGVHSAGWLGEVPPDEPGWKKIGSVPTGPYKGEIIWKHP